MSIPISIPRDFLRTVYPFAGRWLSAVLLCVAVNAAFGDQAPILRTSGISPIYIQGGAAIVVDPLVELYSPDGSLISNITVEISQNYRSDQDLLQYTNPVGGITGSFNVGSGMLTLSGNTNAETFQQALRRVEYVNTDNPLTTGNRKILFNAGDGGTYLSETEHFYEFIPASGITWHDAYTASTQRFYFGCQGYLMTVTSATENAFAVSQLGGNRGWMGASDVESNKVWKWVTGPEKGLHFFTQTQNASGCGVGGTNVPGQYSNWDDGEPNDWNDGCEHGEDYAHFLNDGAWNDYDYDNSNIDGYIVEYGGRTNDPPLHFADAAILQVQSANNPPGTPTLVSPVHGADAGTPGPADDNLSGSGRTQNPRPKLIWQVPSDLDDNKLNFYVWHEPGNTNAGTVYAAFSGSSVSNFSWYVNGSWTNFPLGGVTNYTVGRVGYTPSNDVCTTYTDVYWKVTAYDGIDQSDTSAVRRFLCGGRTWTDDPLPASGPFRDDYLVELREETEYMLFFRGMSSATWTDPTLDADSTPVRDDHIMELRAALTQVVTNTGQQGTTLTNWTDHPIIPMITRMKSDHISELRDAVGGL
jgi:hypothetical protein